VQWVGVTPTDLLQNEGTTEIIIEQNAAGTPVAVISLPEFIEQKARESDLDPRLVRRIAFCESTYRQFDKNGEVLRGKENGFDVGVFQINETFHLEKSKELGLNIHSTEGNIEYAVMLLRDEGSRHWKASRPCWG
jgi:hypothetical protein